MSNESIRRMYDRFSSLPGFWELDAWTCRATARSPYRERLVGALQLDVSARVLDVACGREQLHQTCDEILYEVVYGGFYYLLVGRKR